VRKVEFDYEPYFYLHLPDPHRFADMLEALETIYRVEDCEFSTIYGKLNGYRIYCKAKEIRRIVERIELQTKFHAKLYNVDVRMDQSSSPKTVSFRLGIRIIRTGLIQTFLCRS